MTMGSQDLFSDDELDDLDELEEREESSTEVFGEGESMDM
jgi:hypothetical protein